MSEPITRTYTFYKFVHNCSETDDLLCYVGHTSNVKSRKALHKSRCNNPDSPNHNNKLYQVMRANGGFKNFKMAILGTRENLTKTEAHIIEEEYRKSEKATLNTYCCYLAPEDRAEHHKLAQKKWFNKNLDYHKNWREKNPDYDKNWREANKERVSELNKKWYEANKEKVIENTRKWREAKKQTAQNI